MVESSLGHRMTEGTIHDIASVSTTVAMLADRMAISDVVVAYAHAVDRRDWAAVRACFAPDAHVDGTRMQGAFGDYFPFLQKQLLMFERTTHFVSNHRAQVDGDRAQAETYAVALHFWTDDTANLRRMAVSVRYDDTLERRGRWCIVRRKVVADWRYDDSHPGDLPWELPPLEDRDA
jgi:3-phenylpropionate/cinnamic acid dioxygenase small subunit